MCIWWMWTVVCAHIKMSHNKNYLFAFEFVDQSVECRNPFDDTLPLTLAFATLAYVYLRVRLILVVVSVRCASFSRERCFSFEVNKAKQQKKKWNEIVCSQTICTLASSLACFATKKSDVRPMNECAMRLCIHNTE